MVSIKEFNCQYTNQLRKKHKTWHDGRLKYYEENNRFQLFAEDGRHLSNKSITNSKQLADILNGSGFGNTEHRIFGSYFVIITELTATHEVEALNTSKPVFVKSEYANYIKEGEKKEQATSKHASTVQISKKQMSVSSKVNKPFKPPAIKSRVKLEQQTAAVMKKDLFTQLQGGDSVSLHNSPAEQKSKIKTQGLSQDSFRSSLNVSQTTQFNEPVPELNTLNPIEYICQTNSIIRTGRLRQRNYVIRNSHIVL
ncbi:hypothetical protein C6P41_000794 [Kluyveromyces marxianus]|nr:hypothetical protein C6P43_002679 [Kluyveromyces marxianus]KAG0685149.1 hypothetical protein C6P41_000794 [Kluyveromyces marxianus]